MKSDTIKTWDDFCKSGQDRYTANAINDYFTQDCTLPHVDGEDGLYVYFDGLGCATQYIYFVYEKISESEYKITEYDYAFISSDEPYEKEFKLINKNGQWLLDKVLSYEVYSFLESKYVINKTDVDNYNKFDQMYLYSKLLGDAHDKFAFEEYCDYYLFDMNNDGVQELIIHTGTCEQDRTYTFYTYKKGETIKLGEANGWHSGLEESKDGNIAIYSGGQGYYSCFEYAIEGDSLKETVIAQNAELTDSAQREMAKKYTGIIMTEISEVDIESLHQSLVG